MAEWKTELNRRSKVHPLVWYRFMNDVWQVWLHGEEELKKFRRAANKMHPNITVGLRFSEHNIEFLDEEVRISNSGYVDNSLY